MHLNIFIYLYQPTSCTTFYKFISSLYMFRAHVLIVRRAKIVLYSLWYHHTYRWLSGAQIERGLNLCELQAVSARFFKYSLRHLITPVQHTSLFVAAAHLQV